MWMIYGANGYTGQLVADEAVRRGLTPVLAGRSVSKVLPVARRLGLDHRVFPLDDPAEVDAALQGVSLVLHCAGPFVQTSAPMLDGAIRAGAHYLDITGEIEVFESVFARDPELRRFGVVAVPGVGFDVVPTDGLAAMLGEALPTATELELGFLGLSGVSRGTARTAVHSLGKGSFARIGGRIRSVPAGWRTREVVLGGKPRTLVSIPWGDVSTAYHSTGIPDITTYMALPRAQARAMRWTDAFGPLLGLAPVVSILDKVVQAQVTGPDAQERAEGSAHVWGRATDRQGRWVEGRLTTPEGYAFTAQAAVEAVTRVLDGKVTPGAHTPSSAFGTRFVEELDGVTVEALERSGA